MSEFSCFAPFGLMDFSGEPTDAETAYDGIVSSLQPPTSRETGRVIDTPAFKLDVGTYQEAKVYAMAMQIGYARAALRNARNQRHPLLALDKLPSLERDWAVIPGARDNIATRQAAVAARKALMHGARQGAIEGELRALLGSDFYALRVTAPGERVLTPNDPSTTGAYQSLEVVPKYIQLLDPPLDLHVPVSLRYKLLGTSLAPLAGDVFTFTPGNAGRVEAVTISATSLATHGDGSDGGITATFTKPKDVGSVAMTCAPWQLSTQRHVRVVVSQKAARDAETRRKLHEVLQRHEKFVTDWEILGVSSSTTVGPFVCGQSRVGDDALGAVAFTF